MIPFWKHQGHGEISQSQLNYHQLRTEKGFSEIFGTKLRVLLNSFDTFLMSTTSPYLIAYSLHLQNIRTDTRLLLFGSNWMTSILLYCLTFSFVALSIMTIRVWVLDLLRNKITLVFKTLWYRIFISVTWNLHRMCQSIQVVQISFFFFNK